MGAGLRPQHPSTTITPRKSPTGENFPSSTPGQRMLQDTTNPQVLITASRQLCYLTGRSRSPFSVLRTIHQGFRRTRRCHPYPNPAMENRYPDPLPNSSPPLLRPRERRSFISRR